MVIAHQHTGKKYRKGSTSQGNLRMPNSVTKLRFVALSVPHMKILIWHSSYGANNTSMRYAQLSSGGSHIPTTPTGIRPSQVRQQLSKDGLTGLEIKGIVGIETIDDNLVQSAVGVQGKYRFEKQDLCIILLGIPLLRHLSSAHTLHFPNSQSGTAVRVY